LSVQIARGSGLPESTGQQVPNRPGRLQATQAPWQATLQQTLSAQNPRMQSSLVSQCPPIPDLPQLSEAKSQACPAVHCALLLHFSKQSPVVVSQV
jgi:hypothetical protein